MGIYKDKCFRPVSSRGPFACEANVITATLRKLLKHRAHSGTRRSGTRHSVILPMHILRGQTNTLNRLEPTNIGCLTPGPLGLSGKGECRPWKRLPVVSGLHGWPSSPLILCHRHICVSSRCQWLHGGGREQSSVLIHWSCSQLYAGAHALFGSSSCPPPPG